MRRAYNLTLCCLLIIWRLQAQSNNEFKINPLLLAPNGGGGGAAFIYERAGSQHLAWELGYVNYKSSNNAICNPIFANPNLPNSGCPYLFNYRRVGVYGALRWYFSDPGRARGVFLGIATQYNQPTGIPDKVKDYLHTIPDNSIDFQYKEHQFYFGPLAGYKFVFWKHLVLEGYASWSPNYGIQERLARQSGSSGRAFGGLAIGYRFH